MIIHMNKQRMCLIWFFRKQVQASRLDAERDCVSIPTTMEEYCRKSKNPDQLVQENIDMDDLYDDVDDYDDFSVVLECTGGGDMARTVVRRSLPGTTVILLGLPYDGEGIGLEQLVSGDKKIIGSVGSHAEDFRAAIRLASQINMDRMNEQVYDFQDWRKAWDAHRSKDFLKIKLRLSK